MNPAAPVTSSLMRVSLRAALRALGQVCRLVPLGLELRGALEIRDCLSTAVAPVEGVAEVVVGVRLVRVRRAGAAELLHGLLQDRDRAGVVALLDQLVALVVER